jgi:glycosyltransferase involved in cell wall biosynthesis
VKVAMLIPPYRYGLDPAQWISVPPQGYGGIQWVAAAIIDGLLKCGVEVLLIGAPGSPERAGLSVSAATEDPGVREALQQWKPDLIHDHSNAALLPAVLPWPTVATSHLNGIPARRRNCVYVSDAQRRRSGSVSAPVIPLPVNPESCQFSSRKDDYLLFLGRISAHKGAYEAASFAEAAGLPIKIAGPAWEPEYLQRVLRDFPATVEYLGEVGGAMRTELLSRARAIMVLSQSKGGPFGGTWSEPGATVVSEAAASGTAVIATDNGCLPEIVPGVGVVLAEDSMTTPISAERTLALLPHPEQIRTEAVSRWGHVAIARRYLKLYERAVGGAEWI